MNTTTITRSFNYTDWKNINHKMTVTTKKALGLYGYQSGEWHIVNLETTADNGKTYYKETVNCNGRVQPHSIKEVVPTSDNVTCDKCLKYFK